MNSPSPYLWIQTRDGSPTLWNNELSESFRSVRGAFTESLYAFVAPALGTYLSRKDSPNQDPIIGEFGLGAGTNWFITSLFAGIFDLKISQYFSIERDTRAFEMGLLEWEKSFALAQKFFIHEFPAHAIKIRSLSWEKISKNTPLIFSSLTEACEKLTYRAQIWYHDPFGFDVNPEGYNLEILKMSSELWAPGCRAFSYACNKHFKVSLESVAGVQAEVLSTGHAQLKRERTQWVFNP